ncbi:MAG: efflux RND transporter periplasmic adaptor subunit [Dokdonella sp.]
MNASHHFRRRTLVIVTMVVVAIAIGGFLYFRMQSNVPQPAPGAASQRVSVVNGVTEIVLDSATQERSGIRAEALPVSNHQTEMIAYGTVFDLQPLIDLRTRYASAQADAASTVAVVAASRQEFERNRTLYRDNQNTSLKALQATQAAFLTDQAKMDAATANAESIRGAGRQQFGETLTRWALDAHSPQFERLLNRQDVLLRVTLPLGDSIQAPATIAVVANAAQRLPASLISAAAQSDPAVQGSAFIYRTAAPIAAGTHIVAYLPTSSQVTQGVFIPANAIVWYGGQPWAYVQIKSDRFARRMVSQQAPLDGGFFVTDGIKSGERVVVSGAQLLLSEEMRPPPSSTGCKDPECD